MIGRTPCLATFPNISNLRERHVRNEGAQSSTPYLVIEHEEIVINGQRCPTGRQILAENLDSCAVYEIAAEHTFDIVLTTNETIPFLVAQTN